MIKPMGDNVLVERCKAESATPGGIHIPERAKKKSNRGLVIAVGSGRELDDGTIRPISLKEGDAIIFGEDAGTPLFIKDKPYLIMSERRILAALEEDDKDKLS